MMPVHTSMSRGETGLHGERTTRSTVARAWHILKCSVSNWSQDNSATTGASLAFYCAFSLAPLLIIVLTISGWIVGAEVAYGQLESQLTSLFGKASAGTLLEAMELPRRLPAELRPS